MAWRLHCLVGLGYALLVAAVFHPWLKPFQQPQRGGPELQARFRAGDLTPLFSVWTQVAARSIFERGEWPLWSDHIYCGEPFFAKPQIGVISITTLLCALLPAQVVATWTFLLHLWIAGMAMYAWCLDVLRHGEADLSRAASEPGTAGQRIVTHLAAACGGSIFMLSSLMVEHTMIGHGPIVLVACWTPLVLRFLGRAFRGERPVRCAVLAGVLVAVQVLAGGETMFLYNVIAGALLGLAWVVAPASRARLGIGTTSDSAAEIPNQTFARTSGFSARLTGVLVAGGVVGLVGFGLSAVKVLPGLELMPVSNRAGGLTVEDAGGMVLEFREPAVLRVLLFGVNELKDWRSLFPITLLLAAIGLIAHLRAGPQRPFACAAVLLVVVAITIAHSPTVFGFLWKVLPMFRYQRIPQRALVLSYLGLGLLGSLGVLRLLTAGLFDTARLGFGSGARDRAGSWWPRAIAGGGLLAVLVLESWLALPSLPPTADIRREVRENYILNHIARQPGQFRIHALESTDRNWGIEHVTVPLGLSNLAGWDHLWLREYLGAEGTVGRDVLPFLSASYQAQHPARFWGLMNVRFVTSTRPIQLPGLQFVEKFPISPTSQPAKSAGPYLYENMEWLPRVWVAPRCVSVQGAQVTYRLLDHPRFNPRRIVALADEEHGLGQHRAHDAIIIPASWELAEQRDKFRARNQWLLTYSMQSPGLWQQPDELDEMLEELSQDPEPESPVIETYRPQFIRIRLSGQVGFLMLAEKFAHFPGWQVRTASGPRMLLRANGIASAITLDGTEEWVELRYWPMGMAHGIWITLASLILVPVVGCFGDRLVRGL